MFPEMDTEKLEESYYITYEELKLISYLPFF